MLYGWFADGVVVVHLGFLLFVAVGGMLAWRWRAVVWPHLPAVLWSVVSITIGLKCPLTSIEKYFRQMAGEHVYRGGFIDHYVEGVLYPQRFTPAVRAVVAALVIVGYAVLFRRAAEGAGRSSTYSDAPAAG